MATTLTQTYEAKIQAAQASVKQLADNVFSVPSSRKGVKPHIVTTNSDGVANYCCCDGWKYYHKCYCSIAVTRYVVAQKAVKAAERIVAEAAETPEQAQIDAWVKQGVDRATAERVASAQGRKPVAYKGNLSTTNNQGFSLLR